MNEQSAIDVTCYFCRCFIDKHRTSNQAMNEQSAIDVTSYFCRCLIDEHRTRNQPYE